MGRDLDRYARQTNLRLALGFLLILFIVGDGLICWIYGPQAAGLGLMCILLGLAPGILIWLALLAMEWLIHRRDLDN